MALNYYVITLDLYCGAMIFARRINMKDIDIVIEIDGHTINVNTDMIEEDVIRQRMGLEPKNYD